MKSGKVTINAQVLSTLHQAYQDSGVPAAELSDFLKDVAQIPSDRLEPDLKDRLITFFKGFGQNATLDDVTATYVSDYKIIY